MTDSKDTNPKDAIGSGKLPLHLVPDTLTAYASLSFLEGALKYGKFNWRVAGVRMSIYLDAIERHLTKFRNGEWADPKTNVPHLASVLACIGIILDAKLVGKLTDDRAPAAVQMSELVDSFAGLVASLKETFKDHHPHQHTIEDEARVETFDSQWSPEEIAKVKAAQVPPLEFNMLPARPTPPRSYRGQVDA
jgi:hypothetical protein